MNQSYVTSHNLHGCEEDALDGDNSKEAKAEWERTLGGECLCDGNTYDVTQ